MDDRDDDLIEFEANGAELPLPTTEGHVEHDGARIWYASFGTAAKSVVLLHGGLGHSGNWAHQVPVLVEAGYRVVAVDSRGHGRSTRDARPYTYELMASDVTAVLDALAIGRAAFVGWSDGACIALILGETAPARVRGVFFFACNMDPSGTKDLLPSPLLGRCFRRHSTDYAKLSSTPTAFGEFAEAVSQMQKTQPNYSSSDLAAIRVPVVIAQSERDEFIKREHAEYLSRSIPSADLVLLEGVSHFAPLQRPAQFNAAVLRFLSRIGDR